MTLLLPMLSGLAVADEVPVETVDYRSYLDQARFFVKRGWYPDAEEQLELAVATDDGQLDAEVWFLLAQVRYELADLSGARQAADRALVNAFDEVQTKETRALLTFFEDKFGFVQLVAPVEGAATRLEVELTSTLFDPDLKEFLARLLARLDEEPVVLPYDLGLPAGTYVINGEEVVVERGGEASLDTPLVGTRALALQTLQLEVGAGAALWLGPRATHYTPAPAAQVSLSVPLGGRVVVGGWVDASPTPYLTQAGAVGVAGGVGGAGGRIGVELPRTQPMVVRPSVGWRAGRIGGVELPCAVGSATVCGPDAPGQLYVYAPAVAHGPVVELAAHYQDRRKRSSWGAGLKLVGEYAFATLPEQAEAAARDGTTYGYTVEQRGWSAASVRVLASLSFAF